MNAILTVASIRHGGFRVIRPITGTHNGDEIFEGPQLELQPIEVPLHLLHEILLHIGAAPRERPLHEPNAGEPLLHLVESRSR